MSKPSWFDSSNNIFELSAQPAAADRHPVGNLESLRRVRCLWLISFIQDMRTFLTSSPELGINGLRRYGAVQDSLLLLRADMKQYTLNPPQDDACSEHEFARLACLFFICVLLQASAPAGDAASPLAAPNNFDLMDASLQARDIWSGSVEDLHTALFHHFAQLLDSPQTTNYVLQMTNVLASLSREARRGVEKCLLQILSPVESDDDGSPLDDWTPDSLLSSLRGL